MGHHARDCPHDHRATGARHSDMRRDRREHTANAGSGDSGEGELMLGAFHNGQEYPEQLEFLK
eukprot:9739366-Heterocapsa_arctica.AAC.1